MDAATSWLPDLPEYCTSLRGSTSQRLSTPTNTDNVREEAAAQESEEATAHGGFNGLSNWGTYGRRPVFSCTVEGKTFLLNHLSPLQTPKRNVPFPMQSRSPAENFYTFRLETRLLKTSIEYVTQFQCHEPYLLLRSPLTGNWTKGSVEKIGNGLLQWVRQLLFFR